MPSPSSTPFAMQQSQLIYPALCFYPLNDSFVPKYISLQGSQRVKIGRQTNAKTIPGERNGYFDSKVLSRQHAEVWEENGKIYLKDVKSSNGTFVNGERLSGEGVESDPFELKTDDLVEFGIDIVAEDNKTIIHHKVAAKVVCIITAEDAANASRDAYNYQHHTQGNSAPMNANGQRRPTIQPQASNSMSGMNGINGLGGLGPNTNRPGKSGLTFEHILGRLRDEMQKSRETNVELNVVVNSMGEIAEVIGGGQPANLPPFPQTLPPVRPASQPQNLPQQEPVVSSAALHTLQSQLAETQASLSSHVEKIRTLETLLSEQEGIKREIGALRALLEDRDREHGRNVVHSQAPDSEDEDDEDDSRSVHTIVPHELESVPEEDETDLEMDDTDEERFARRAELGRPRTPEPSSLGMREEDDEHSDQEQEPPEGTEGPVELLPSPPPAVPDEISHRLSILSDQLESALELSRSLQAQHTAAQQTIESLEIKVSSLETLVQATEAAKAAEDAKIAEREAQLERERQITLSALFAEFQRKIEIQWDSVKSEWDAEREKMDKVKAEMESRLKGMEDGLSGSATKLDVELGTFAAQLAKLNTIPYGRGKGNGLVTPPSPARSLSPDSDRRRKRSPRRGRSRSRSASPSTTLVDGSGSSNGTRPSPPVSVNSRSSSPSTGSIAPLTDSESISPENAFSTSQFLPTPESSLMKRKNEDVTSAQKQAPALNVNSTMAIGAVLISIAAAALLWRAKE